MKNTAIKKENRPFSNPAQLAEMLKLRSSGWSLRALASRYGVHDHHAIHYHCIKNGLPLKPQGITRDILMFYHSKRIDLRPTILQVLRINFGKNVRMEERVNQGKNYKDYIKKQEDLTILLKRYE